MQRKNNILKSARSGMAMIMAIAVIVVLAGIMTLSLSLTAQTTKRTADLYLYEQAILLSKSATEYALLRIGLANPCTIKNINFTHKDIYDINISLKYIYTEDATCDNAGNSDARYFNVQTDEQNGSVLVDVIVTTNDNAQIGEPIIYFRRSLNKL